MIISFVSFVIYLIEYFVSAYSKDGRRLGDKLAGTKVIDLKPERPGWLFVILSVILLILFSICNLLFLNK